MGVQLQQITEVITPLLETFSVGILGNPFAFEALQNFTTSTGTQTLLAALRNATDVGLPLLQRILVRLLYCLCRCQSKFCPNIYQPQSTAWLGCANKQKAVSVLQGTANFLGNITSILESEINLLSPPATAQPEPAAQTLSATPLYSEHVPPWRQAGGRGLLQAPVCASTAFAVQEGNGAGDEQSSQALCLMCLSLPVGGFPV